MITKNVSTLKINKLSQAQLDKIIADGTIKDDEIYLTPSEETDYGGYLRRYKSLSELNIDTPTTTDVVCAALPSNSILVMAANNTAITDLPQSYGTLEIARAATNYCTASFTQSNSTSVTAYLGKYATNVTPNWTGWHKILVQSNTTNSYTSGSQTTATGNNSRAGGSQTTALGTNSCAEGHSTNKATNYILNSDGSVKSNSDIISAWSTNNFSLAKGDHSQVSGNNCLALGNSSTARGTLNVAYVINSCAEGHMTQAMGDNSHSEGRKTTAYGNCSHAEGNSSNKATDYIMNSDGTIKNDDEIASAHYLSTHNSSEDQFSLAKGDYSHVSGSNCLALGKFSSACGKNSSARGECSHAEGDTTDAFGLSSHSEGSNTTASGDYSHAEGNNSSAEGEYSHSEGSNTTASGTSSHSEGSNTTASGDYSHAEGNNSSAEGNNSHAQGNSTIAKGNNSFARGYGAQALGGSSYAGGYQTTAYGNCSHAEGSSSNKATDYMYKPASSEILDDDSIYGKWTSNKFSLAKGSYAQVSGNNCLALGNYSFARGNQTIAYGDNSYSDGNNTQALSYQHAQGHYNNVSNATAGSSSGTTGTAFIIGNGTSSSESNAFRVSYDGTPYSKKALNTTGADYAEFFEWQDSNIDSEDRRGYFVTLDGDKIKIANSDDYILGIISGQPSVVGNGDEDWRGRYILDDFGAFICEDFEYEETVSENILNEETGEIEVVEKTITKVGKRYKENPDYNPELGYIQREDRPEWDYVGMLGVISVRDDGTCEVNGYCKVADGGIATASETGYRVIKRISDDVVRVIFR